MTKLLGIDTSRESRGAALGWLIQSREVDEDAFCAFLLRDELSALERLMFALLRSPADRVRALDSTLLWAVLNRPRYRGEVSGRVWLFAAALRACLPRMRSGQDRRAQLLAAFELPGDPAGHDSALLRSLGGEQTLLAFLTYGLALADEEIDGLLGCPGGWAQTRMEAVRTALTAHREICPTCRAGFERTADLEAALAAALSAGKAAYSSADQAAWQAALLQRAGRERGAAKRRTRMAQAAQAAGFVCAALLGVWLLGNFGRSGLFRPAQTSRPGPTAVRSGPSRAITPGPPVPPVPFSTPPPFSSPAPPPARVDEAAELRSLMRQTANSFVLWDTLWADVRVIRHSLTGLDILPEQVIRKQIWIDQIDLSSRVVLGRSDGPPLATYVVAGNHIRGWNFESGEALQASSPELIADGDLRGLLRPADSFLPGGEFRLVGKEEIIAGQKTAVLDWYSAGQRVFRYWLDYRRGVVLRRLEYGGRNFGEVVSELVVTEIYYDAGLPGSIFQLEAYRADHFAHDLYGAPEIPDYSSVLKSGLPARLRSPAGQAEGGLVFQDPHVRLAQDGGRATANLFAGGALLGQIPLGGASLLSCQRSPDGQRIAYASLPQNRGGDTALFIADLTAPEAAHAVLPAGLTAGDYAFSPDGRKLAFFGCDQNASFCGLFLLELDSGTLTPLTRLAYADHLLWNPEGTRLALVGGGNSTDVLEQRSGKNLMLSEIAALAQIWHYVVIDPANGDVLYKRVYDWTHPGAPADSPSNQWPVSFKSRTAGLDGCAAPAPAE